MELSNLPEECISHIISLTSPKDTCRLSLASPLIRAISDSDTVWNKFLPNDFSEIISRRSVFYPILLDINSMPKKALFLYLSDNPVIIDNGTMSFSLEKQSGKKCFMLAPKALSIVWSNTDNYWTWITLPESRFSEVAKLNWVCWLEINGKLEANILSRETTYGAYLVYKLEERRYGFDRRAARLRVDYEGQGNEDGLGVYLDPSVNVPPLPRERGDGWMEVEMGSFFNEQGEDGSVLCGLREVDDYNPKSGLIIEGIELRPKDVLGAIGLQM